MDAATLRLILIVVGAALVLALYLWERSRVEAPDEDDLSLGGEDKREPIVGRVDELAESDEDDLDAPEVAPNGRREAVAFASLQAASRRAATIPEAAVHLVADATPDPDPDAPGGENTLILQVGILARDRDMAGPDILDVAARCGLRPGELGAFHHQVMVGEGAKAEIADAGPMDDAGDEDADEQTRTLFSMVSMVKPGAFPFDAMEDFRTRGLLLFAVLRHSPDNLQILDDMIAAARRLADEFDAEVIDERRKPLTPIMVDVLRARVQEFDRRARSVRR